MPDQNFSLSIWVDQTPAEVYDAINQPQHWWSDSITGSPGTLNNEWQYHFGDNHKTRFRTTLLEPGKQVVWLVLENYFKNAQDQTEWVGNEIHFVIVKDGDKTKLTFTQIGLVPSYACYKNCAWAWTGFVEKSLQSLIESGAGKLHWYQ